MQHTRYEVSAPTWLTALLTEKFFVTCAQHDSNVVKKRVEKNSFCLDCICGVCQHCVPDHTSHRLLQVRRYVYHDVIRLHDIQRLFDCSRVQTYVINSAKVVFLNERPQPKSSKALGNNCQSCDRSLQDAYRYCSVACKVEAVFNKKAAGRGKKGSTGSHDGEEVGDSTPRCCDKKFCASLGTATPNYARIEYGSIGRAWDQNRLHGRDDLCQLSCTSSECSSATDCEFGSWDGCNAASLSLNLCNKTSTAALLASEHFKQYCLDDQYPIASATFRYKLCNKRIRTYSPCSVIIPASLRRRKAGKPQRSPLS